MQQSSGVQEQSGGASEAVAALGRCAVKLMPRQRQWSRLKHALCSTHLSLFMVGWIVAVLPLWLCLWLRRCGELGDLTRRQTIGWQIESATFPSLTFHDRWCSSHDHTASHSEWSDK